MAIPYSGLIFSAIAAYLIPTHVLLFLNVSLRITVATLLLCMPIFFAGLVFVRSFADLRFAGAALGWNLFGAVFGGMLETTSQATGMRALTLMAVGLYVGPGLHDRKHGLCPARMPYPRPRRVRSFGGYAVAESASACHSADHRLAVVSLPFRGFHG